MPRLNVDRRSFIKVLAAGSAVGLAVSGAAGFASKTVSGKAPTGQSQFPSSSSSSSSGGGVQPYSYLVYRNSSTGLYDALNGLTGAIDYSGSNAATVIQSAVNGAPTGGSVFLHLASYTGTGSVTNTRGLSIIAQGGATFSGFMMPAFARLASTVTRHITVTPSGPFDGGDFGPNTLR